MILAGQSSAKVSAADTKWRSLAAKHFHHGITPNELSQFKQGETLGDVPDACWLDIAKTQWTLRSMLRQAFRFTDGTSYHQYSRAMRKQRVWRFDDAHPRMWRFSPDTRAMESEIYGCVQQQGLSESASEWLLAQLDARVENAEHIAEHGTWDSDQHAEWLFGEMTKADQKGRIRVFYTPESIHFRCEKKEDCGRLMYPTDGVLQNVWRQQTESARGVYATRTMPQTCGAIQLPISVENVQVTQGMDSFGTLNHEHEHAVNAYIGHPSTWIGAPIRNESGLEYCARLAIGDIVKEELIAWSLRWRTSYTDLFLGEQASYKPVTEAKRILANAGLQAAELEEFTDEGYRQLTFLLGTPTHALQSLLSQYSHSIIREMLRLIPIQRWGIVAKQLEQRKKR